MPKIETITDKYNLNITISLDYLVAEYDYNLILVDRYHRLLGVGKRNEAGGKSITLPAWCMKDGDYILKVQAIEDNKVISEESYDLSFREKTLHIEFLRMQQVLGMHDSMNFNYVLRRKLLAKQKMKLQQQVSEWERKKYEAKYIEHMDAIYCDGRDYYA